jgi:hypothetical protein
MAATKKNRKGTPSKDIGGPDMARTRERSQLLDPNGGSAVKIEDFEMGLAKRVALGIPCDFSVQSSPDTHMRVKKLVCKVPRGMFYIRGIYVANLSCLSGDPIDAAALIDSHVDYPTMTPANRMRMDVSYTGLVPDDLKSMPVEDTTMATVLKMLSEIEAESDLTTIRARIKATIEKMPTFLFSVTASGPSTLTA